MTKLTPLRLAALTVIAMCVGFVPLTAKDAQLRVGSKKFTESVILGEILKHLAADQGVEAVHLSELGGTRLLFDALTSGELDAYAEYTGTIEKEILAGADHRPGESARSRLRAVGIELSPPLGFNNTYALGMTRTRAQQLGVTTISDLRRFPDLVFGFSNEFIDRADGWIGLSQAYQLPQSDVRGLDHDIAYRQLDAGSIDVLDVYSTDAKVVRHDLVLLEDDRSFFPRYDAVWLYRTDLKMRSPDFVRAINEVPGRLSVTAMTAMNEQVESGFATEPAAAAGYLKSEFGIERTVRVVTATDRILARTAEHVDLVRRSLIPAILVAIPLGILAHRRPRVGQVILAVTGLIQTIPALALLVMLIPVAAMLGLSSLGAGSETAVLALFGYSLLPIVRNTHSGLAGIPVDHVESGEVLGLSRQTQLLQIHLPLASPMILAGIKTAVVQNIGFATLGSLVGAGGYGQPILTGIRLNDTSLIMEGAVPAATLAVFAQLGFEAVERIVVPRGLRLSRDR